MKDKKIDSLIFEEINRQDNCINLIASENHVSEDVLSVLGTELTNKYAEGYPGARYYGGNQVIDKIEYLCKERALETFKLSSKDWHVNVQSLSGSPANLAVYNALVPIGKKIMGMSLDHGGHLTHGHKVSFTGKIWKQVPYGVDKKTEMLNYTELKRIAIKEKPYIIVAGYTAYSRIIDWKRMRNIANSCGAILMVDMSHIAGLIAGDQYPSPFKYADVVTTTTHKTLRGPRHALIFCKQKYVNLIDKSVFPGLQGGPHMNTIAAVAVALREAQQPNFKQYAKQIVKNSSKLAFELSILDNRIISGGTDTHLFLIDTWRDGSGISGKEASEKLEKQNIIVNMNTIPFDTKTPFNPSGIRIGLASITTRGWKEKDMKLLAIRINDILKSKI